MISRIETFLSRAILESKASHEALWPGDLPCISNRFTRVNFSNLENLDIKRPTQKQVRDCVKALDEQLPNWETTEGIDRLVVTLLHNFPDLQKN